ncbi:hypothetical protein Q9L42_020715 (plasmid) [Methylomarinum sp. Ch1-1]|uniref:Uncharacterized protein n=1 Tax=Methylomarinum roseum TaxID=3067653 RepID=A0AAU7P062_9GAMM|nr:hypothetical protein [Methylomarinum sp. Ch1-1]MDP4523342.1 hypothetical protein [Methylomarinum sp. Ch1-1]
MTYAGYLVLHHHKEGVSTYVAVTEKNIELDLEDFIQKNHIDFEEDKEESISIEPIFLPEGFEIHKTNPVSAELVDKLVALIDSSSEDVVSELDDQVTSLYEGKASDLNNAGVHSQVECLIKELGEKNVRQLLASFSSSACPKQ